MDTFLFILSLQANFLVIVFVNICFHVNLVCR